MPRENTWSEKEEEFLTKIEKQCTIYASYFNKDHIYYHKLSSRFNIPILVISSLNALCAIALNDFLVQKYVSILNAVLSAGTGVLGSIQLYMKINEKMTNSLRSQILMKRLSLKITKELSVDREHRSSEGPIFLQECFGEFNAALEQANPIEKKLQNFMTLAEPGNEMYKRLLEPRAKTILNLTDAVQKDVDSLRGSESPVYQSASAPSPGESTPKVSDGEP